MWQSILSGLLGSAMNKQSPQVQDVNWDKNKTLQSVNTPNANQGSGGGWLSGLLDMMQNKGNGVWGSGIEADNGQILPGTKATKQELDWKKKGY